MNSGMRFLVILCVLTIICVLVTAQSSDDFCGRDLTFLSVNADAARIVTNNQTESVLEFDLGAGDPFMVIHMCDARCNSSHCGRAWESDKLDSVFVIGDDTEIYEAIQIPAVWQEDVMILAQISGKANTSDDVINAVLGMPQYDVGAGVLSFDIIDLDPELPDNAPGMTAAKLSAFEGVSLIGQELNPGDELDIRTEAGKCEPTQASIFLTNPSISIRVSDDDEMANSTLTFANASQSVLLSTTCDTDCSDSCGSKWIQNANTSLSEWMPSQLVRVDMVQAISELLLDEQASLMMMRLMRDMSEDPNVLDDDISVSLLLSLPFYDIASDEMHFAFEVTAINSEINNRRRKLLDIDPLEDWLSLSSNYGAFWKY